MEPKHCPSAIQDYIDREYVDSDTTFAVVYDMKPIRDIDKPLDGGHRRMIATEASVQYRHCWKAWGDYPGGGGGCSPTEAGVIYVGDLEGECVVLGYASENLEDRLELPYLDGPRIEP